MISTTGQKLIAFTKKEWLPLKGMASTKSNGYFTKRNGFHSKEWPPLKGVASTKRNGFY